MNDILDWQELLGFGEPLLSVRVGDREVTLHRKEANGLAHDRAPVGSLGYQVVAPDADASEGGMVHHPWSGTVVGDQRIIYGELPSPAVVGEATIDGGDRVPVHLAAGAWVVVAPCARKMTLVFRNAKGRSVKKSRIDPWRAWPDRSVIEANWREQPTYTPEPHRDWSEDANNPDFVRALVKRYGLGEPLVTVQVGECAASLYRQTATGKLFDAIDCKGGPGGGFGPIGGDFGYQTTQLGSQQVIVGLLPPNVVTLEAITAEGQQLGVHIASGAFLVVAPFTAEVKLTFRNARGRAVWSHRIEAEGQITFPGFFGLIRLYWRLLRIGWWRRRQRGAPRHQ